MREELVALVQGEISVSSFEAGLVADAILAAGWTPPTVTGRVVRLNKWADGSYQEVYSDGSYGPVVPPPVKPTIEQVMDVLVMSPLSDTAGTDLRPFEQTARAVLDLFPGRTEADALAPIRAALAAHPRCDSHSDDGPITCGWKVAVHDIQNALEEVGRD